MFGAGSLDLTPSKPTFPIAPEIISRPDNEFVLRYRQQFKSVTHSHIVKYAVVMKLNVQVCEIKEDAVVGIHRDDP